MTCIVSLTPVLNYKLAPCTFVSVIMYFWRSRDVYRFVMGCLILYWLWVCPDLLSVINRKLLVLLNTCVPRWCFQVMCWGIHNSAVVNKTSKCMYMMIMVCFVHSFCKHFAVELEIASSIWLELACVYASDCLQPTKVWPLFISPVVLFASVFHGSRG